MKKHTLLIFFLSISISLFSQTKWSETFSTSSYQNKIIEDNKRDVEYNVFGDFEINYYVYESEKTHGYVNINSESDSKRYKLVEGSFNKVLDKNGKTLYLDFMAKADHLKSSVSVNIWGDSVNLSYILPSGQMIIEVYKK
ncbi:hypothetical protein [Olleya namhaensis]|uniref:Uncharacterized protein n=1 Tax=Olleya namhaensis TaxID=1144750 RepID=A0A1I3J5S6_9FLAO|nr:hypothetical protein [Olleya namhaensis]SFI55691.1 hypothetical protein SAMN05443431_101268 [Olleya namhaensis]